MPAPFSYLISIKGTFGGGAYGGAIYQGPYVNRTKSCIRIKVHAVIEFEVQIANAQDLFKNTEFKGNWIRAGTTTTNSMDGSGGESYGGAIFAINEMAIESCEFLSNIAEG